MGLRERRAINLVETEQVPAALAEIKQWLGVAPPITIDWSGMEDGGDEPILRVQGMALSPITRAMYTASHEDFTKKEFAKAIKGFHIRAASSAAEKSLTVADGVLTLSAFFGDHYAGGFNDQQVFDILLDRL